MTRIFTRYASNRGKLFILIAGLIAVMLVAAACGSSSANSDSKPDAQTNSPAPEVNTSGTVPVIPLESIIVSSEVSGAQQPVVETRAVSSVALGAPSAQFSSTQQLGIWVTGHGEVTTTPDLAILQVGVEARASTVGAARAQASQAMDGVTRVLEDKDIEARDIQTRFFNISPEYTFNRDRGRQELVGFRVDNQLTVRIRDIGSVGVLIDDVAAAAGDSVRIQGLTFTVDDTTALEAQAREKAVQNLMAKAQQLADLTGVQLGSPLYLSESGGFVPRPQPIFARAMAEASLEAAPPPTSINAGELTVSVNIQGTFSITE